MVPTHASIAARMRELADIDTRAAQRERASLIELCQGIGHDHRPQWPYLNKPGPCIGCGKKAD
jgi:hypothetical protein